jgi:hypothetical protein
MAIPVRAFASARLAAQAGYAILHAYAFLLLGFATRVTLRSSRQSFYNILWAVVFGFATLNILSLAGRRFEPTRRGLSFGEFMAVSIVVVSIILLSLELLTALHLFPIRIRR